MKVLGFGGNFTVLNSNVGHVIDRGLMSLLYAAPYYASGNLDKLNDMFQGIPLHDFLPEGIFALISSVTVKESTVIIGGTLSPTDPQLSKLEKDQVKWAGKTPNEDDLFLLGRDRTPENPEGFELKEENCKKPPKPISSASNVAHQVVPLCFMVIILYVW